MEGGDNLGMKFVHKKIVFFFNSQTSLRSKLELGYSKFIYTELTLKILNYLMILAARSKFGSDKIF